MEKYKIISKICLISFLFLSCTFTGRYKDKYELISGTLIGKRLDSRERLFLSIQTEESVIAGFLFNRYSSNVIKDLDSRLVLQEKIIIYGLKINRVDEFVEGIDYRIYVIAYEDKELNKLLIIQADYSEGVLEKFRELNIKNIVPFLLQMKKFI